MHIKSLVAAAAALTVMFAVPAGAAEELATDNVWKFASLAGVIAAPMEEDQMSETRGANIQLNVRDKGTVLLGENVPQKLIDMVGAIHVCVGGGGKPVAATSC